MAWQITGSDDDKLIMNGSLVIGSIKRQGGLMKGWRVEVLWSGRHGDITFDAPTLMAAQAFVAGVERTVEAMEAG